MQAQVQHAGRGRLEVGGHLHGHGQQHLALIAVVEQRAHAQRLGHGPLDLARRQARRQLPVQLGGQAGVTGVLPVGMPFGLVGDQQAQPQCLARLYAFGRLGHELGAHARRVHGRCRPAAGFQADLRAGLEGQQAGGCQKEGKKPEGEALGCGVARRRLEWHGGLWEPGAGSLVPLATGGDGSGHAPWNPLCVVARRLAKDIVA